MARFGFPSSWLLMSSTGALPDMTGPSPAPAPAADVDVTSFLGDGGGGGIRSPPVIARQGSILSAVAAAVGRNKAAAGSGDAVAGGGFRSLSSVAASPLGGHDGGFADILDTYKPEKSSRVGGVVLATQETAKAAAPVLERRYSTKMITAGPAAAAAPDAGAAELLSHIKSSYVSMVDSILEKQQELKKTQERLQRLRVELAAEEQLEQELMLSLSETFRSPAKKAASVKKTVAADEHVAEAPESPSPLEASSEAPPPPSFFSEESTVEDHSTENSCFTEADDAEDQSEPQHRSAPFSFTGEPEKTVSEHIKSLLGGIEVEAILEDTRKARSRYDPDRYAGDEAAESLLADMLEYRSSLDRSWLLLLCGTRASDLSVLGCF